MISGQTLHIGPEGNRFPLCANAGASGPDAPKQLSFPPPPVGVRLAPVRMALLVLADQNAKTHAGLAVALFAKLMEADHFRLHGVLGMGGCCDNRSTC